MSEQLVKDLAAGAPASSLPPSSLPWRRSCRPAADEPRLPPLTRPCHHPTLPRAAAVDALIVQDPAVVMIAKRAAPHLPIHASTQQTITSAEGAEWAAAMGCERVVLGRELSVREIGAVVDKCSVEVEVFVHGGERARRRARSRNPAAPRSVDEPSTCDAPGRWSSNTHSPCPSSGAAALCVSYSGQCFSSETWGGRSANRGQCAQARRTPAPMLPCSHAPMPLTTMILSLCARRRAGCRTGCSSTDRSPSWETCSTSSLRRCLPHPAPCLALPLTPQPLDAHRHRHDRPPHATATQIKRYQPVDLLASHSIS